MHQQGSEVQPHCSSDCPIGASHKTSYNDKARKLMKTGAQKNNSETSTGTNITISIIATPKIIKKKQEFGTYKMKINIWIHLEQTLKRLNPISLSTEMSQKLKFHMQK